MANFRDVNRAIKAEFPNLDIQAVRGEICVFFEGSDGFDKIASVGASPVSTNTETMIKLCIRNIKDAQEAAAFREEAKEVFAADPAPKAKVVYESNPSQKQSFVQDNFVGLKAVGQSVRLFGAVVPQFDYDNTYAQRLANELRLLREKHGFVFDRCPGRQWGTWHCKRLVKPSVSRRIERLLKLLDIALYGKLKHPHWYYAGCCVGRDHRFSAAPFLKGEVYAK